MDVVYVVRPGDNNEELRYSLRSLANLPHDRVFIVGHTPPWVRNVTSLQTIQAGTKYANSTRNVLTACGTDEVSDPFVLMNDDFFIVRPIGEVPTLHRGPVADVVTEYRVRYRRIASQYIVGMTETRDLLLELGHTKPLSYELHVPLVVHKEAMSKAIETATVAGLEVPHKRTLYGNLAGVGGTQARDVKVIYRAAVHVPSPFVSTSDMSFHEGWIGRKLRGMFTEASRYEA